MHLYFLLLYKRKLKHSIHKHCYLDEVICAVMTDLALELQTGFPPIQLASSIASMAQLSISPYTPLYEIFGFTFGELSYYPSLSDSVVSTYGTITA